MIRFGCHSENIPPTMLRKIMPGLSSGGSPAPAGASPLPDPLRAQEVFFMIRLLGFDCIDVSSRQLVPQESILADPDGCAGKLSELSEMAGLPLSELFLSNIRLNGEDIPADADAARSKAFCHAFESICRFAAKAGFKSIMGGSCKAPSLDDYPAVLHRCASTLRLQTEIASSFGLAFHIEP